MNKPAIRCAIYTRKSVEDGLEQEFNSLDAQRSMCESYIQSRKAEGWVILPNHYDDGGYSGGNTKRPALQALSNDIEAGKVDTVVVYKIDRLTRSMLDFVKLNEQWQEHQVNSISITQDINTSSFVGRMLLNILMSFAQYEMEMASERIRDKIAASAQKGLFCTGMPPLGYKKDPDTHALVIIPKEGKLVKHIFRRYLKLNSCGLVAKELNHEGITTRHWVSRQNIEHGGHPWNTSEVRKILVNPLYAGWIRHKKDRYQGKHEALVAQKIFDAAQELLQSKGERQKLTNTCHRGEAILTGLLFCANCNCAMTSSYTVKNQKRYFYYACQQTLKFAEHHCPLCKIPTGEIEKIIHYQLGFVFGTYSFQEVLTGECRAQRQKLYDNLRAEHRGLKSFLKKTPDNNHLADQLEKKGSQMALLKHDIVSIKEYISHFDNLWSFITPSSRILLLESCIAHVKMDNTHVRTLLHSDLNEYEAEIRSVLKSSESLTTIEQTSQGLLLVSPIRIQKLGGRTRIELVGMEYDYNRRSFLKAIAMAWQGIELLESGLVPNIPALARKMKLSITYVNNILKLGVLSPQIVERIAQGTIPDDLTLAVLRNPIPLDWTEQWKLLMKEPM